MSYRSFMLSLGPVLRKYGVWILLVLVVIAAGFLLFHPAKTGNVPLPEPDQNMGVGK